MAFGRAKKGIRMRDDQTLGSLIRTIKGNRTFEQFSRDTGLSVATLSKYMTGNFNSVIRVSTLEKLAKQAPFGTDISLDDLKCAAGLPDEKSASDTYSNVLFENADYEYDNAVIKPQSEAESENRKKVLGEIAKLVMGTHGKLTIDSSALINKSLEGSNLLSLRVNGHGRVIDWIIYLLIKEKKTPIRQDLNTLIGDLALQESAPTLKRSILTNDSNIYKRLVNASDLLNSSFRGDLSAILAKEGTLEIEEEQYISLYDAYSELFSILWV